jgi:excisionase family DNA binding protein
MSLNIDEKPVASFTPTETVFVDEDEAARRLKVSKRKMQRWRENGGGPAYYKFGQAVRYTPADLMTFAAAQRRHSTSE